MPKIVYPDLSFKVTGLCFKVANELGRFCRERQYADMFEELLKESNLKYQREYEIKNLVPASPAGNRADFLIEHNDEKIIVDFKSKTFVTKEDYVQMQRYLKAANIRLGLIVNFRHTYLKPKRVLNAEFDSQLSRVNSLNSNR